MKRILLLSSVATALLLPQAASAETKAAVLYIPTGDVMLTPSGTDICIAVSMSDYNNGLGCVPGLEEARVESAHPMAEALAGDIGTALEPYNVHVTTTRPPEYMPYYTIFASNETNDESESRSCVGAPNVCAGRGRDLMGFTNGGTMNCMGPDTLQTMLYAFGRMSGLEGSMNAMDAMHYPPDFMTPATGFVDECVTIAPLIGGKDGMTELPLECTSVDHEGGDCMMGEQNPHQDLIAYFGAASEDADAPVIENMMPADGDTIGEDDDLSVSMTVSDASPHVAVMLKVESPALEGVDNPALLDGSLSACTSSWCDFDFLSGDPFRENDGAWELDLPGLPGGEYTITFAAADYHGNVAEEVVITVTKEGGPIDPTDSDTDGGSDSDSDSDSESDSMATTDSNGSDTNDTFLDTGNSDSDSDSDSDTEGDDDDDEDDGGGADMEDDGGCGCTTDEGAGGAMAFFLGLVGFGLTRRRRS